MKMFLLCFFFLAVQLVSSNKPTSKDKDTCSENTIICQFIGTSWKSTYEFNVNDLQNALSRCQVVLYGTFDYDRKGTNNQVLESDKNVLRTLKEYNKIVYIMIGFSNKGEWAQVLEPKDQILYNNNVKSLKEFINTFNIRGVIFDYSFNVFNPDYPHTVEAIHSFVNDIKRGIDSLKVGIVLLGADYYSYSDTNIFNISCLNPIMDYFIIDISVLNFCDGGTICEGLSPVRSSNSSLITMETVTNAIENSPMDKCKVVAMLLVSTAKPEDDNSNANMFGTYSELCIAASNHEEFVNTLCFANTTILYNQGKFARDHFPSLLINTIEGDDSSGVCRCHPFVAANSILDGWESGVFQPCAGIDNIHKCT